MTEQEISEFNKLADKRHCGKLTKKEFSRWKVLVNKSFLEGLPKIADAWFRGFNILKDRNKQ